MENSLSQIIIFALAGIMHALPAISILFIAFYYKSKKGNTTEGSLFIIGSILIIISAIVTQISMITVASGILSAERYSTILLIFNSFTFIGGILTAIGLYLIIKKVITIP